MAISTGTRIGPYDIVAPLGAGGMGEVYRALVMELVEGSTLADRIAQGPIPLEATQGEYDATIPMRAWDASADGQRFLLTRVGESTEKPVTTLHVVLNWTDALKRLAPPK